MGQAGGEILPRGVEAAPLIAPHLEAARRLEPQERPDLTLQSEVVHEPHRVEEREPVGLEREIKEVRAAVQPQYGELRADVVPCSGAEKQR